MWKALAHIICDGTSRSFPFIGLQKGADKDMGRRGLQMVGFKGQIDGEPVTTMSGRHQMTSLGDLIN